MGWDWLNPFGHNDQWWNPIKDVGTVVETVALPFGLAGATIGDLTGVDNVKPSQVISGYQDFFSKNPQISLSQRLDAAADSNAFYKAAEAPFALAGKIGSGAVQATTKSLVDVVAAVPGGLAQGVKANASNLGLLALVGGAVLVGVLAFHHRGASHA